MWYGPGLENPAADACSRLTSRQLMDIENATRTRAFLVPLVEKWVSPEGEPVDEFVPLREDSFSHDEVGPQPYDHLYVSLRSGCSVGKGPDVDGDAEPALHFDTEPAFEPEELEHCSRMRRRLRIHNSPKYISTMLAMRYQTCRPTPTTFTR